MIPTARILIATIPAWGHVAPTIAIAQRLQDQGHAVAYACHQDVAPSLRAAGQEVLTDYPWNDCVARVIREVGGGKKRWVTWIKAARGIPTMLLVDDLERSTDAFIRLIRRWRPDVLLIDQHFFCGSIAAEACGLPYATSYPFVLPLAGQGLPPYGLGLPLGRRTWFWPVAEFGVGVVAKSTDGRINRLRRRLGLRMVRGSFFEPSPYLCLSYTTEAFEYPRPGLPPQVHLVGPSITRRRGDTGPPFPWDWLDGRPLVYIAMGTLNTRETSFYKRAIEASRDQPWQLVASVGRHQDPSLWADLPGNILLQPYVPQLELLGRVQTMITHGGHNSVNEALAAGVPMIVAPAAVDQFEAAQRVVEAGCGLRVKLHKVSAMELRGAIRRLLSEAGFRANAARMAADFARCDGPATSASLLLRLAESRQPILRRPGQRATIYADKHEAGDESQEEQIPG